MARLIAVVLALSAMGNLASCALIPVPAFFARLLSGCSYVGIVAAGLCFRSMGGLAAAGLFSISSVAIGMLVCGQTLAEQGEVPVFALVGLATGLLAECMEPPSKTGVEELRFGRLDRGGADVSWYAGRQISPGLLGEVRTPLSAITGAAYILEDLALTEENRQEMVSIILKECHSLDVLLRPLEFSGQRPPAYREVTLSSILDGVVRLAESLTATAALTLRKKVMPDITLICDPQLIEQAVLNLLTNAIRVMERGDEIVLSAGKQGDHLTIELSHPRMGLLYQIAVYDTRSLQKSDSSTFARPRKLLKPETSGA